MENLLTNKTQYYIVQEREENGNKYIEPLYYNSTLRIYATTSELQYATSYATYAEANKRKELLEMLASFDESAAGTIVYHVVKNTTTNEIVENSEA